MYKLILLAAIAMAPKVNAQISETPGSVVFEEAHPDTSFFYAKDGRISRVYGKAFSEGNSLSSLEIESTKELEWLDKNRLLTLKKKIDNKFFYTLAAYEFEDLKKIEKEITKNDSIIHYQLNK